MILDLMIVQGRGELLDEVDLIASTSVRISQVLQYPHPRVQLLYGLVGHLDHTGELCSQQLRESHLGRKRSW